MFSWELILQPILPGLVTSQRKSKGLFLRVKEVGAGAWTSSKITCAVQSLPYIRTLDHIVLNHKRNKPVHATLQAVLCRRGSFDPGLATPQGMRLSQSPIAFYMTVSVAENMLCVQRQPQKTQKLSCSSSPCSLQEVPDDL